MIKRIIWLNLKDNQTKLHIFILICIGLLVTSLQFRQIRTDDIKNLYMGYIILQTYGGLPVDYSVIVDVFSFILWIVPNILVLYLINLSVVNRFRESGTLVLSRVKRKKDWFIAYNITINIKIILYFLVLFLSSLVLIWFKKGNSSFENTLICINTITNANMNQYILLVYIILLNILTLIAVQYFLNNLYYIFYNSNESSLIGIVFFIFPVFFIKKGIWCNFLLINNGMIKRHEIFNNGLEGLGIGNSLFFIIIFIVINFLVGIFIIKKRDII